MKSLHRLFVLLVAGLSGLIPLPAQEQESLSPTAVQRTPAELDTLLGPIALYPDPLIALILPAATVPADIVLAARHLKAGNNDLSQVEHRAWDDSVKSLTRFPDVLKWMDENLTWTKQVGEAFAENQAAVMETVQRLRQRARAAGTLVDTPQQQVLAEADVVRIVPAQPDVIYVPRYEPAVVYVERPVYYPQPFLTFGVGYPVGSWLSYDCDWAHRKVWMGDRHRRWRGHDWRQPVIPIRRNFAGSSSARPWSPPVRPLRPTITVAHPSYRPATTARPITAANSFANRNPNPEPRTVPSVRPPTTNLQPRSHLPATRHPNTGPRVATTISPRLPAPSYAPTYSPPVTGPASLPSPGSRRQHHANGHSRFQGSAVNPSAAPAQVAPSLPVTVAPSLPMARSTWTPPRHSNSSSPVAPASAPAFSGTPAPQRPAPSAQPAAAPGDSNDRRRHRHESDRRR